MPRTLKLTIAYDGSAYSGWQRQANAQGIQAVIEDEIAAIVGAANPLVAAGRTDAGVHAAAQVASITIDHPISCDDLLKALNILVKMVPSGNVSNASERNMLEQSLMRNTQNGQQQQMLKQSQAQKPPAGQPAPQAPPAAGAAA